MRLTRLSKPYARTRSPRFLTPDGRGLGTDFHGDLNGGKLDLSDKKRANSDSGDLGASEWLMVLQDSRAIAGATFRLSS